MSLSQDLLTLGVHFGEGKFLFFFALSHPIIGTSYRAVTGLARPFLVMCTLESVLRRF